MDDEGSVIVDTVYEAIRLVREACRDSCARSICEDIEDAIMLLLDEAGDTEEISALALHAVEVAAETLRRAAERARALGCRRSRPLLEEASLLLTRLSSQRARPAPRGWGI